MANRVFGLGIVLVIATIGLAACGPTLPAPVRDSQAPAEAQQESSPLASPSRPSGAEPAPALEASALPPAALEVQKQLAIQQGLAPEAVNVLSVEVVDWPDSCLDLVQPGEMCAAVITPGFRITLEVNGQRFVIHTNADGSAYRVAEGSAP